MDYFGRFTIFSMKTMKNLTYFLLIATLIFVFRPATAQKKRAKVETPDEITIDARLYEGMEWRNVGPYRGGRSAAVTGVPGQPNLYYFGSTGGGVWKTENGGQTWSNLSDGFFGGSVGSVAVSEYDPNVIYVGGGEKTVRGNVSYGYGIWKSTDAGKTWAFTGLPDSRHIPRIRIHPKNPDLVFAAVLGDLYKPTGERGVYRSNDGGQSWERILFVNDRAGAIDLILDPLNPRILYASTWRVFRTPYSLESGGEGSGLWKSNDGGDTWIDISRNEGMPSGTLGIIGLAVSPVKRDRVFAIIEAAEGGVYRSEDGGEKWTRVNDDRSLRQRAWYYSRIYADTEDEDIVYVVNVRYHRSKDGGKSFQSYSAPHGDHHDLWISPEDNQRMIIGDDGGAQVSFDGGANWSTYHNQPTAQFYRVTTDNHFPYRIYGAQQDNSTVRILHRTEGNSINERDWEPTAGGESAHIAVDPENDDVVYGGSYGGFLTRVDHETGEERAINVWPDNPMGYGAEGMKYRFQWNFPIMFSPHNPDKLYAASNHLHVSYNEGQSWEIISPDLTRNDPEKLVSSGGPITKDNTGVEYYCTIFAMAESPQEEGVIWTGSDDGLIHISRDGGASWVNVTPESMPEWIMVNSIDVDPFEKGGAYITATSYKSGDYQPYLYRTKDYGNSWQKITNGIAQDHFTRVLRADPGKKGLLYAGTESGIYISFDDGQSWKPFQLNLPVVPITDLVIKNNNLIASTQGRGFWLIDDITPLHQLDQVNESSEFHLFRPIPAYRMGGSQNKEVKTAGTNHPGGVLINFYLHEKPDTTINVEVKILEASGKLIKKFDNQAKEKNNKIDLKKGFNQFSWNMRYPDAEDFDGMILWWASLRGPLAVPGNYKARLVVDTDSAEVPFTILKDPRSSVSSSAWQAQFDFLIEVRDMVTKTHRAIIDIRKMQEQLSFLKSKIGSDDEHQNIVIQIDSISSGLRAIEETLYQTKNRSGQDPLNYPIKLNNKLAHLMSLCSMGDYQPTDQAVVFKDEVVSEIDLQLEKLKVMIDTDVQSLNQMVREARIDAIKPETREN